MRSCSVVNSTTKAANPIPAAAPSSIAMARNARPPAVSPPADKSADAKLASSANPPQPTVPARQRANQVFIVIPLHPVDSDTSTIRRHGVKPFNRDPKGSARAAQITRVERFMRALPFGSRLNMGG